MSDPIFDSARPPIERLLALMARLREPGRGCPWDVEQTFESIAPHTIEEAYEVAEAIQRRDMPGLEDELGDLLLQVVFHAQMASEQGLFDFDGVALAICDKLIRRHPHVFGDMLIEDAVHQTRAWEEHKAAERAGSAGGGGGGDGGPTSAIDGVSLAYPALMRAVKLQKRAARVGFDWDAASEVLAKIAEEAAELEREMVANAPKERLEDEIGDLLFSCVNLARKLDVDPETALRHANAKFERRFRRMETRLGKRPEDASLAEMDVHWNQVKDDE